MLKHRKDYADHHRTTEQERDSIEHEVSFQAYPLKPLSETVYDHYQFFFLIIRSLSLDVNGIIGK